MLVEANANNGPFEADIKLYIRCGIPDLWVTLLFSPPSFSHLVIGVLLTFFAPNLVLVTPMPLLLNALGIFGTLLACVSHAGSVPTKDCTALDSDGPIFVTADCTDADYVPVIHGETDESSPIPHRKVSGYFNGTESLFNIYLPTDGSWQGRFFQFVYPTHTENATDETIAFGADSGGYTVQINGGIGYRADAAAAKFSKEVAAEFYEHEERIHGYIYGGSGGSLQTSGAVENTEGVWDGAVPIVQAIPISFMNNPTPRGLAGLVLRNKSEEIENALKPGGSMDPYAGLNPVQRQILEEVTQLGNPILSWQDFDAIGDMTDLSLLNYDVRGIDPTYADDFWNEVGYLGSEESPLGDLLRSRLVNESTTIRSITRDDDGKPTNVTLDAVPDEEYHLGLDFTLVSKNGTEVGLIRGTLDGNTVGIQSTTGDTVLEALEQDLEVRIDNIWFIAMHAYYRHQVPTRDGYDAWDYLRNSTGHPIYPQRPMEVSVLISSNAAGGGTHTGNIRFKTIVVDNLLDEQAYPWHAHWYREQVKRHLGDELDDNYRLWYNDNADHDFGEVPESRASIVVEFTGIYHQALRDLAAWVEDGVAPPLSTNHTISSDTQVLVPEDASLRFGIQPYVKLSVGNGSCTGIASGSEVSMNVYAEVPPDAGSIISVKWDYLGTGDFVAHELDSAAESLHLQKSFEYSTPGTYFPAVRVTSQREGSMTSPFRHVSNLGRARIVVS